jgi:hypothetical protein
LKEPSPALNADIEECIRCAREVGRFSGIYLTMRDAHGDIEAIKRLVETDVFSAGFKQLQRLGILQHSCEAIVLRHPKEFEASTKAYAQFKLEQAGFFKPERTHNA